MTKTGRIRTRAFLLAALTLSLAMDAFAVSLGERIAERRANRLQEELDDSREAASLPAGIRVIRDVAYGRDEEQRYDVYLPRQGRDAPVILMVHGGGWKFGDKAERAVIENKVPYWTSQGFVFISINYRMLPRSGPIDQADDVAKALAAAQRNAATWGGDPAKFILMGHSAGAHLVALLTAAPETALRHGAMPWLGTVMLDGAGLDIPKIMGQRHFALYDEAFGDDAAYWQRVSPYHQLQSGAYPMLAVCSTLRKEACEQARAFAARATAMGVRTQVQEQRLTHREINLRLGERSAYTETVDAFIRSLVGRRQ